jgi:sugar (pentulose or hexulose) kinase
MFCRAGLDPTVTLEDVAAQWIEEAEQFSPEPEAHQVYQRLEELFNRYLEQNEALHELLSEAACPDQLDQ